MIYMQSNNVGLQPANDAPLKEVINCYGGGDGLLLELQLSLSKWRIEDNIMPPDNLLLLLQHIFHYTSLGGLSCEDAVVREMISSILNVIMRRAVKLESSGVFYNNNNNNNNENNEEEDNEKASYIREIIAITSAAISNCCGGTTRHNADMQLWINLKDDNNNSNNEKDNNTILRIVFGFTDYSAGETGARLWAGAVALSLYLLENLHYILRPASHSTISSYSNNNNNNNNNNRTSLSLLSDKENKEEKEKESIHIIELGCGPGLVSLVLAESIIQFPSLCPLSTLSQLYLDVTDISPAVITEVENSFLKRNGPKLAAAFIEGKIQSFSLDFTNIPISLYGKYDVVLGSDIIYDYNIALYVAPAIVLLLKPAGLAFLCCESHRDGMETFVANIKITMGDLLEVVENYKDVCQELKQLRMIEGLTSSTCSLVVLRRR